jgi:threonine dehydrogenase-like Zn-dependent dehydrogenase
MQALVFTAVGKLEMQDVPAPAPDAGEVTVHVRASAICGSELHGFRSGGMRVPPLVMGHEFAGVTDEGDRVVVNPLLSCHECPACLAGRPQLCARRGLIGVSRPGGFAQAVAVPRSSLVPLPDHIGFSQATLVEPLANAIHAVNLLPTPLGRVGVVGAGPIGLLCAQVARHRGAEVTIAEVADNRRRYAESLGLAAATGLAGPYDAVIDAVGSSATRADSVAQVRAGGTAVWLGLATPEVSLDGSSLVRGERRVVGSFAYAPSEFAEAVGLLDELDTEWLTEHPLQDAVEVFYAMADGESPDIKAVLVPAETS